MAVIERIVGVEPMRENEWPMVYWVGHDGATEIVQQTRDCGTYTLVWFDVFKGSNNRVASINALTGVSQIHYKEGPFHDPH